MPDGQTHLAHLQSARTFVLLIATPLVAVGLSENQYWWAGVLIYVGYFLGYTLLSRFLDPDADQLSLTSSEGRLMRELGCFGFFIVWWLFPYAYVMKWFGGHRGLSHVHIIGTVTRVLWVFWPAVAVWWWYYFIGFAYVWPFIAGLFAGLSVADSLHIYLDNKSG